MNKTSALSLILGASIAISATACSFKLKMGGDSETPENGAASAAPEATEAPEPSATTEPAATATATGTATTAPPATAAPEPKAKLKLKKTMIVLPGNITFESGKASFKADAGSEAVLDEVAKVLQDNPKVEKVRVEGHTDAQGAQDANLQLSYDRAKTVKDYLVGKGIAADKVLIIGFGPLYPIGDMTTEEGRAMNRRIEIHVAVAGGKNYLGKDPATGGRMGGKTE